MNQSLLPLEVHDLTVTYNRKPVLYGIDLEIEEGGLIGIIGPNGAGKSTLIKAIMGIVPSAGGWVKILGKVEKNHIEELAMCPRENLWIGTSRFLFWMWS